jgi:hypothetical protein
MARYQLSQLFRYADGGHLVNGHEKYRPRLTVSYSPD